MALDIPLPWIKGPDVLGAASSGASAGAQAGRLEEESRDSSARIALEAAGMQQRTQMEAQRLSHEEYMAQMEAASRKEILQQNQLRENQKLAIDQAYHQAQLGIAKGRLEEQQAIASAKSQEAAMRLKREQDFSAAVAGGDSVMEALRKFPVPASVVNSIRQAQPPEKPDKTRYFNTKGTIVRVNPDGTTDEIYKPKDESPSILGSAGETAPEKPGMIDRLKGMVGLGPKTPPPKAPYNASSPSKFGYPKVGEVRSGHRFKGGDPNDQNNWELVNEGS